MLSTLNKRSSQKGPDDDISECKRKKYGFGYCLSDKMWVLRNFARNEGDKISVEEILEMYSKEHEKNKENSGDAPQTLSRNSLGRIIQDLWSGSVRLARLGKRGEKAQRYYLNMGKVLRSSNTAGLETIHNNLNTTTDQDAVLTSLRELELPNNWIKITNSTTSLSFLRTEKWTLNGQRMVTELNIAKEHSEFVIKLSSQGVVLDIMDTNFGSELTGLKVYERVQLLIAFLDNAETGICCGFSLPVGQESLALHTNYRIVEIKCLDKRDSRTSEKCVFSKECKLFSSPGQCCSSCALLKKRETVKQSKISSKGKDIKAKCNDRWLSKEQLKEKISRLRKDLQNATAREKNLREKFESQLLQMEESDSTDLESMMGMIEDKDVPPNMQMLWEQQMEIMKTKSKHGYRWHPKIIQMCLELYCKNPHVLDTIREVIYLPSNKTIRWHKNKREEKPGWQWDTISWCLEKAEEQNLKECDYWGGLVIDEMKVQENVEMIIKKNKQQNIEHRLVGFVQLGSLHDDMRKLEGKTDPELASHVLQFMFLSDGGFRFPVAQFPSHDLTASDLYDIFWKGVLMMMEHNFTIYWCVLDGADVNCPFRNSKRAWGRV